MLPDPLALKVLCYPLSIPPVLEASQSAQVAARKPESTQKALTANLAGRDLNL